LYWRKRTEDYRCSCCGLLVRDDALAGRLEPVRDAFRDGLWSLRRARALEASGDADGAQVYRRKALGHFRRVATIMPRWKIGPIAGMRQVQDLNG